MNNNNQAARFGGSRKASQKNDRPNFDTLVSKDGRVKATVSGGKCVLTWPHTKAKSVTLPRIGDGAVMFGNEHVRATLHVDGVGRDTRLRLELPGATLLEECHD